MIRLMLVFLLVSCTTSATAQVTPCREKPKLIIADSQSLQDQLTNCSDNNLNCVVRDRIEVNETLFFWGDSCLSGKGELVFNIDTIPDPYLVNIGISGKSGGSVANNQAERPFTGTIKNLTFTINNLSAEQGRTIYYWRTDGSKLKNVTFNMGDSRYSATTSGNHNGWLSGANNYIRKNIKIKGNTVNATATNLGSEGIGLGLFDGALITENTIIGVGDDPIGIHFCDNVTVTHNTTKAVDGRLYFANSSNVEIAHNKITRIASLQNGHFYTGIALIYLGFEHKNTSRFPAPQDHYIHHNELYYDAGAIDQGPSINLLGVRGVQVENNYVENNSDLMNVPAIHVLPQPINGTWTDPTGLDTGNVARVYQVDLFRNVATDQRMVMTGNCVDYVEFPTVVRNIATSYQFYCDSTEINNRYVNP